MFYTNHHLRVEFLRQTQMRRFLNDCRDALDKAAPEARTNFNGEEIRGKFLGKLSDGKVKNSIARIHASTSEDVSMERSSLVYLFGLLRLLRAHTR